MSQNLKIKSITLKMPLLGYPAGTALQNNLYIQDESGVVLNKDGWGIAGVFAIHENDIIKSCDLVFKIEYEKPKSKTLFAVEKPRLWQDYFYIDNDGLVRSRQWAGDETDIRCFNRNNVFLTQENAQKQADRKQLLADIEKFAVENNEEIDWSGKLLKTKWTLSYRDGNWRLMENPYHKVVGAIYFSSKTIATQALEKFKDRLDILLD